MLRLKAGALTETETGELPNGLSRPAPYLDILVNDQRQARHTTGLNHRS